MSLSGVITCYELACPPASERNNSIWSSSDVIVKCFRRPTDAPRLDKNILLPILNGPAAVTVIVKTSRSETEANRPIRHTCDYTLEGLQSGTYLIFAYEVCEDAEQSLVHPTRQASGWIEHTVSNREITTTNANIILRKPHSFFADGYPVQMNNVRFFTLNHIPVLQLYAATPADRGYAHGYLLAPHILDWFQFYLLEENFESLEGYTEFYTLVDPAAKFFHYPAEYLLEIHGILSGMQARVDCDLFLYELHRPFDAIDLLAMNSYIERRTVRPDSRTMGIIPTEPHCSQVVVWNSRTSDQRMIAGRNMDGECDLRRITVSTTLLFAVDGSETPKQYRYVSLSWPGMIGVLSGVNETGFYCMENAAPSQIGGQIRGLTPVSYVAAHALRTVNARLASKHDIRAAFELFACDPSLNRDTKLWPNMPATSDLRGPICGPGSIYVLTTMFDGGNEAFVLEGDRYGGRLRASMDAEPHIRDCILATNHFCLYGSSRAVSGEQENFCLPVSFSSKHRYESMCHRLEAQLRTRETAAESDVQQIRSVLQAACEGRTEHAIEVELEVNGNITFHIHLTALEFGRWYAPYEAARTMNFEDLFK